MGRGQQQPRPEIDRRPAGRNLRHGDDGAGATLSWAVRSAPSEFQSNAWLDDRFRVVHSPRAICSEA